MPTRGGTLPTTLWICSLSLGIMAAIAFIAFPEIDLIVGGVFHLGNGTFSGQSLGWAPKLRDFFLVAFYLCIAASLAGLFITRNSL
jgi:hypothetical protein